MESIAEIFTDNLGSFDVLNSSVEACINDLNALGEDVEVIYADGARWLHVHDGGLVKLNAM